MEEREDLCRRAGDMELSTFIAKLQWLGRKHKMTHQRLLSIFLHAPQPTDLPVAEILSIRNKLAEEGTERTPAEVVDTVERALCKLRNWMRDAGRDVPDSDVLLLWMLRHEA